MAFAVVVAAACAAATSGQGATNMVVTDPFGNTSGGEEAPEVETIRPLKVDTPAPSKTWLGYLIGGAMSAAALGAVIMPSKRTHQD